MNAPARTCRRSGCSADISTRAPNAKYCWACAYGVHRERLTHKLELRSHLCVDCSVSLGERSAHTQRCLACAGKHDAARRNGVIPPVRASNWRAELNKMIAEARLRVLDAGLERRATWLLERVVKHERAQALEVARATVDCGAWGIVEALRKRI